MQKKLDHYIIFPSGMKIPYRLYRVKWILAKNELILGQPTKAFRIWIILILKIVWAPVGQVIHCRDWWIALACESRTGLCACHPTNISLCVISLVDRQWSRKIAVASTHGEARDQDNDFSLLVSVCVCVCTCCDVILIIIDIQHHADNSLRLSWKQQSIFIQRPLTSVWLFYGKLC